MARVFILGAGASRFAKYPLALDLWRFVRDYSSGEVMAERRRTEAVTAIENILAVVPPAEHDQPNLEELFTLLDLTELGTQPLQLAHSSWGVLRPKVMGMIADAFQWHEYLLQQDVIFGRKSFLPAPDRPRVHEVLQHWTRIIAPKDTILTFNWDLLHEAALWRAKKWHYSDGYGFVSSDAPPDTHSQTLVLKLHGSVNWAQSDVLDPVPVIEHKADFFRGSMDGPGTYLRGAGQWNEGRYLIIPTYLKDISTNRLLLTIWNQAADALLTASEWVVIGFQLHPADTHARHLFGSALLRHRESLQITVVAPEAPHWPGFCAHFGLTVARVRETFEQWVRSAASTRP